MARTPGVNVTRRGGNWAVIRDNAGRASRLFDTQREAIDYGRNVARNEQAEMRIQDRNHRWRDSDSYGGDPAPPIDKEH